ncbi:phenylacetate--CoA ligase [Christensenella minuta]|uniref:phenylacetate--CoA ligase family protein n=1 Tax=Christensenella minuta TaxID=626937 RepID=UPI0007DFA2F0|nr:phenylacetate--CoA ligase [Christensenella minuta]AYH41660.1 phenylacetate--CoA ligase family protein [Christensenella minuta]MDY3751098.1 phenylacetate--CoA ligase [Christensenella minuta]OAQ43427.1 phenylacetate--CoA ligase [Christensenella minuta]
MIWDREFECADRKKIKELQLERLRHTVQYCYDNVPHYRKKFSEIGLKPEHIKTLRDIEKIPFTTKEDFRANYPYDMFAVPMKEIVRLHGSSGTTGNPVVTGYTRHDLDMWTGLVSRVACAAGVVPDDIAQISFGYGLFTGGFGLHYGLERVGLSVIPVSSGNTKRQIKFMQDFGSTVLISTPSYAMYLGETAQEMGIDFKKLKLRLGLFGGEGHTKEMQKQIEKYLNITDTENYGLTEVIGPGFSGECYIQNGMHIADDEFISEVIDPETGEVLPMGEKGELVVTSLTKEGVPILRYRTKDITRLMDEPCKCGRTTTRMEKVSGRTDDMLVIRGVNVFPSQIEGVLLGMDDVAPHYEIVLTTEKHLDRIEVKVEVADAELLTSYSALENLREKIANNIYSILNMHVKVTLAEPHTLKRFEGKARRVTDMRSQ